MQLYRSKNHGQRIFIAPRTFLLEMKGKLLACLLDEPTDVFDVGTREQQRHLSASGTGCDIGKRAAGEL
jgi:hypothetical protein